MPKKITKLQLTRLYWPAWRAAEKVLLTHHYSKAEAEEKRKEIHQEICGIPISSKGLTNPQLDKVLGRFRAISDPNDGSSQARLAKQAMTRMRYKITEIQKRCGLSDDYLDTMARQIAKRPLDHCTTQGLKKILAALNYHESRHPEQVETESPLHHPAGD